MNKVLVLLSTYNGEQYLREQLDSIFAQKEVEFHIFVRDDGSKDSTIEILEEYNAKYGKMTIMAEQNIGSALSFYDLMFKADSYLENFDYYAFADQDDYWFPRKLIESVTQLNKQSAFYKLYYGKVTATNSRLEPIKTVTIMPSMSLASNIVSSRALGCTMVFNRNLLHKACLISDYLNKRKKLDYIPYHDGWMSLVAYSLGGAVVVGKEPLMFYRQHEHNAVGTGKNIFGLIKARFIRYINSEKTKSKKCQIVLELLENEIPSQNRKLLFLCAYYSQSLKKRIQLVCRKDLYEYGFIDNIGTFGVIILNKF